MPESHNDTWVPTPEYLESHPGARDPDDCYGPMNPDAKKPATEAFVPEKWHMDPLGPGPGMEVRQTVTFAVKPHRVIKISISAHTSDEADDLKVCLSNSVIFNNLDSPTQREALFKTIGELDDAFLRAFLSAQIAQSEAAHVEQ